LRKTYEEYAGGSGAVQADADAPDVAAKVQTESQAALDDELKSALGTDRWEKYQKLQEPAFQTLSRVTERFNLAPQLADQAYDYIKVAQEHSQRLLTDPGVDQDK